MAGNAYLQTAVDKYYQFYNQPLRGLAFKAGLGVRRACFQALTLKKAVATIAMMQHAHNCTRRDVGSSCSAKERTMCWNQVCIHSPDVRLCWNSPSGLTAKSRPRGQVCQSLTCMAADPSFLPCVAGGATQCKRRMTTRRTADGSAQEQLPTGKAAEATAKLDKGCITNDIRSGRKRRDNCSNIPDTKRSITLAVERWLVLWGFVPLFYRSLGDPPRMLRSYLGI